MPLSEEERRRLAADDVARRRRSDDREGSFEDRLEQERRDRAAGFDRRLDALDRKVDGIVPAVGAIVNGRFTKIEDQYRREFAERDERMRREFEDRDRRLAEDRMRLEAISKSLSDLRDAEVGNAVVRAWFRSVLVAAGIAAVLGIAGIVTGKVQQIITALQTSPAPVNPRPSRVLPPEAQGEHEYDPEPEQARRDRERRNWRGRP